MPILPCDTDATWDQADVQQTFALAIQAGRSRHVTDAKSETVMAKTNDAALAAFIARKVEIDAALERIRAASDDHFFIGPDEVNRGHVTALADYAELLKRIIDAVFCEASTPSDLGFAEICAHRRLSPTRRSTIIP